MEVKGNVLRKNEEGDRCLALASWGGFPRSELAAPRQRGCSKNCKCPREGGSQDPLKMQEQQRVLAVGCGKNPS